MQTMQNAILFSKMIKKFHIFGLLLIILLSWKKKKKIFLIFKFKGGHIKSWYNIRTYFHDL